MRVHPTAVVSPRARIGEGTVIGANTFIDQDVTIGPGCVVSPNVTILRYTTLGARCRVHAGAVLGDVPQDINYQGVRSYVRIGNDSVIREGVTIHRGTGEETETVVGDRCLLMANCHLGHNVRLGNEVTITNGALLAGYVDVGDRVRHSHWGEGVVREIVGMGDRAEAIVVFNGYGAKRLLLAWAPLEKVS
ncbi:MAG TPA: hypothetical protein EYP14_06985 [Planctomycetaceae bacterium]|nr:hypothetical protein [Planctomycetaceae bacterium]